MSHTVREFMTASPYTLKVGSTLAAAYELMRRERIRHLPVVAEGGKLVGVLSEREVFLAKNERGIPPEDVTVDELMAKSPFRVSPDAAIEEAAQEMAQHRYGSAVVVDREHVVGIFTTTDALRALVTLGTLKH